MFLLLKEQSRFTFKYGTEVGEPMHAVRRAMVLLLVLLASPLVSLAPTGSAAPTDSLEIAAANWHIIEDVEMGTSALKAVDYRIHLAIGSFDPLSEEAPWSGIKDDFDYRRTGMAIVQLNHHTGEALYDLVDNHGVFVLDHMGGSAWLVRLSQPGDLSAIQHDETVRWAGIMQPGWRLSPDLDSHTNLIAAIPAADLIPEALEGLAHDLVLMGADEAWCGLHLCEITGTIDYSQLARDGRIIFSEPTYSLRLTNAMAGAVVGVDAVTNNAPFTLDGSGETISFTDTGLDSDHPDIVGRVAATYTQFGLDPSPADTNGGHGTHVAITMVGDGSGDASAKGIAPSANIIVYALEHDPTGVFGRLGSIYDMLSHAEQEGSRVSVNAWGLNGNLGKYTADSRSLDVFVRDNPEFLPIFSAGDDVHQDPSRIMPPSTAKNVLSVGATTNSGTMANFSAQGPSMDGRVKPDIVAPGVGICSGQAEEATAPMGWSCASGTHSNGNSMYMTLDGSSQATAVVGGTVSLTREYIREQVGIPSPSAALLKAAVINGAIDLGTPDIPNSAEGWGQINLERTILPMDGSTYLQTFVDDGRVLNAGYSTVYSFELDASHGIDLTLAWTDVAGSANEDQNNSRLVNDLDLILVSPDGTLYKGNVIFNGESVPNGVSDSVNNIERVRIAPGSVVTSGQWQVKVEHTGGLEQSFGLVLTAKANPIPSTDLIVFDGSIHSSSESPLLNDLITLRISWFNQGTLPAGSFRVTLEDLTTGETLYDSTRTGLDDGIIDSVTMYHQFNSTGIHDMRLSIDVDNDVVEINDASNGTDNNILNMQIEVKALGVRLVPLDLSGAADNNRINQTLDPRNGVGMTWPILLKHEGTGTESVKLTISQVQIPHPVRDDFLLPPEDNWSKSSDLSGPFTLSPMGEGGDQIHLNITMTDDDADISGDIPRYAEAGEFLVDVTARYEFDQSVSHTIRLRLTVMEVKDVMVAPAGTDGLEAAPGGNTAFSMSVMNTGNAPAVYDLDCYSENRWQVQLGQSNSSSYSFEPLDILEYLPMQVRLYVPPVADGLPAAGSQDFISCSVTSVQDPELNITEVVVLTVKALQSFDTELFDHEGLEVGPSSLARDIAVDTSERVNLTLGVENTGNTALDLTMRVSPELTTWTIGVTHGEESDSREVSFSIQPGGSTTVVIAVLVSPTASMGDSNRLVFKTSVNQAIFLNNETTLVVKDELSVELDTSGSDTFDVRVDGEWNYFEFTIENTGNSLVTLSWDHSIAPDGWQVGFANPTVILDSRDIADIRIGVIPPAGETAGISEFELGIFVDATNGFETISEDVRITIDIQETTYAVISPIDDTERPLLSIARDGSATQNLTITNQGNSVLDATLVASVITEDGELVKDWEVSLSKDSFEDLAIGGVVQFTVTATPNDDTETGIVTVRITATTADTNSSLDLETSVESRRSQGGLFGIMPVWAASLVIFAIIAAGAVVAIRIKRSAPKNYEGEELVAPDAHSLPDGGERLDAMMDLVSKTSITSGSVSAEEIADALAGSIPQLPPPPAEVPDGRPPRMDTPTGRPPAAIPANRPPTAPAVAPAPVAEPAGPPLPPTGLPPGWSMEQWQHYGHQWLIQQGQQ